MNHQGSPRITELSQLKTRDTWRQIGRGATATIFLTESVRSQVVVKEIDVNIRNMQRFQDQLAQVMPLKHPNIVRVSFYFFLLALSPFFSFL